MPWMTERRKGIVRVENGRRTADIPDDFVLVGESIEIRQEEDGTISIYPTSEEGREALSSFNPFGDWKDDDVQDS